MKKIAITMGDPGGIGPEIALKAVSATIHDYEHILVGDRAVFKETAVMLRKNGTFLPFSLQDEISIIDSGSAKGFTKTSPSIEGGEAAYQAIVKATEIAMAGDVDAVATAPISKEGLNLAGHKWPGHTELMAHLTNTKDFAMMLMGGGLRVMLVTIHEPLSNVPKLITKASVLKTLHLAQKACELLTIKNPRIAVAGLNPHAGEAGLIGKEEAKIIIPAIEAAKAEGIPVTGPYPADSLFYKAYNGQFDLVVSMYHDQGLVPLKLLAFETGVNVTIGLPIVRTSPDHGSAFDIAWRGNANPMSMIQATRLAADLVE